MAAVARELCVRELVGFRTAVRSCLSTSARRIKGCATPAGRVCYGRGEARRDVLAIGVSRRVKRKFVRCKLEQRDGCGQAERWFIGCAKTCDECGCVCQPRVAPLGTLAMKQISFQPSRFTRICIHREVYGYPENVGAVRSYSYRMPKLWRSCSNPNVARCLSMAVFHIEPAQSP